MIFSLNLVHLYSTVKINVMILIPEEEYETMELELFTQRMEHSIRKGKRISHEEAEKRLTQMSLYPTRMSQY